MSSVGRALAETKQGNAYFINVAEIDTTNGDLYSYNATSNTISAVASVPGLTATQAAGTLLVKDMGKTVTVADDTYRKVQVYSIAGVADATLASVTFYIKLTPATGNTCEWARMTLQA